MGCVSAAGKYFELVPQNIYQSGQSLTMFYIPATKIWLMTLTIPYLSLLIFAAVSDGCALVMALRRLAKYIILER